MKKDFYTRILSEVFIFFIIFTIAVIIYKRYNPFVLPEIEWRLIVILAFLGFLLVLTKVIRIDLFNIKISVKKKAKTKTRKISKKIVLSDITLSLIAWARKHPIRTILFIVYLFFLYIIYPTMSIHDFSFFALLLYIPISIKLKLDERIPIAFALFLLIISAIALAQGFEDRANLIAIYAYYFLVIGVILLFIDYMKSSHIRSSRFE
ncbi:MAG: hypothetical protein QXJ96_02975 [Candidatus Aenigmatarchaeota archaeon]|nr:hypothetical protein [Candidatus Aenigmarchaeota archaeon]